MTLSANQLDLGEPKVCLAWSRRAIIRIGQIEPDAIVTLLTTTRSQGDARGDFIPTGFRQAWIALPAVPIIALRDNPRAEFDVMHCVDRLFPRTASCNVSRRANMADDLFPIVDVPANMQAVDFTDHFCVGDVCPAIKGGILVYRDATHMTATFARTFANDLQAVLAKLDVLLPGEGTAGPDLGDAARVARTSAN